MAKPFDSREAAAKAALEESMILSNRHEYAGVIYQQGDKYYYTPPSTSGRKHNVTVKVKYPKGSKVMGLYHTHPDGDDSQFFSQTDVEVARQVGVPYYMGHIKDKSLRMFDPKTTKVTGGRPGGRARVSRHFYSEGSPLELPVTMAPVAPAEPSPLEHRELLRRAAEGKPTTPRTPE